MTKAVISESRYNLLTEAVVYMRSLLADALRYGLAECENLRSELISERIDNSQLRLEISRSSHYLEIAEAKLRNRTKPAIPKEGPEAEIARLKQKISDQSQELAKINKIKIPKSVETTESREQLLAVIAARDREIVRLQTALSMANTHDAGRRAKTERHAMNNSIDRMFYRGVLRAIALGDERIIDLAKRKFSAIKADYQVDLIGDDGDLRRSGD